MFEQALKHNIRFTGTTGRDKKFLMAYLIRRNLLHFESALLSEQILDVAIFDKKTPRLLGHLEKGDSQNIHTAVSAFFEFAQYAGGHITHQTSLLYSQLHQGLSHLPYTLSNTLSSLITTTSTALHTSLDTLHCFIIHYRSIPLHTLHLTLRYRLTTNPSCTNQPCI